MTEHNIKYVNTIYSLILFIVQIEHWRNFVDIFFCFHFTTPFFPVQTDRFKISRAGGAFLTFKRQN